MKMNLVSEKHSTIHSLIQITEKIKGSNRKGVFWMWTTYRSKKMHLMQS